MRRIVALALALGMCAPVVMAQESWGVFFAWDAGGVVDVPERPAWDASVEAPASSYMAPATPPLGPVPGSGMQSSSQDVPSGSGALGMPEPRKIKGADLRYAFLLPPARQLAMSPPWKSAPLSEAGWFVDGSGEYWMAVSQRPGSPAHRWQRGIDLGAENDGTGWRVIGRLEVTVTPRDEDESYSFRYFTRDDSTLSRRHYPRETLNASVEEDLCGWAGDCIAAALDSTYALTVRKGE